MRALAVRCCSTSGAPGWTRTPPPDGYVTSPVTPVSTSHGCTPHLLRHTFVTTMLDAGVDLRDVQIAARHADPRTTMRYDRARKKPAGTRLHPRGVHGLRNMRTRFGWSSGRL